MIYDLKSAQTYAENGRSEEWIHNYSIIGSGSNPDLSDSFKRIKRYWRGPLKLPIDGLIRILGREPDTIYRESQQIWDMRTDAIANSLTNLEELPPLILKYTAGDLFLSDGNHRHGALQKLGWSDCWAFILYNSPEEMKEHLIKTEFAPKSGKHTGQYEEESIREHSPCHI